MSLEMTVLHSMRRVQEPQGQPHRTTSCNVLAVWHFHRYIRKRITSW